MEVGDRREIIAEITLLKARLFYGFFSCILLYVNRFVLVLVFQVTTEP